MLQSMTGFGRGEASNNEVSVVVELKSVNNRFRDIQLRVPREYMALEPRINRMLKDPFRRGRIDAFVRRSGVASSQQVTADVGLAVAYERVINEIAGEMVGYVDKQVPFTFILGQPGVLRVTEATVDAVKEWPVVESGGAARLDTKISLRSRGVVDVSRIAVALGGGGHSGAAGVQLNLSVEEAIRRVRSEAKKVLG